MSGKTLTREQILAMLAAGPARIAAATAGLKPAPLQAPPAPDEWSANDVLAHLRSCADVWGNCIETILKQDEPTIRAVNPRTWIQSTGYLAQKFEPSLQAFTAQRTALLKRLDPLSIESWSRKATVTGAGKPLVRTVLTYAESIAIHERPHLKQIERIANTMRSQQK